MNISTIKIELAKRIFDTDDLNVLKKISDIFNSKSENWLDEFPEEIADSLNKSLEQSAKGETISHEEAMTNFEKWLKK